MLYELPLHNHFLLLMLSFLWVQEGILNNEAVLEHHLWFCWESSGREPLSVFWWEAIGGGVRAVCTWWFSLLFRGKPLDSVLLCTENVFYQRLPTIRL